MIIFTKETSGKEIWKPWRGGGGTDCCNDCRKNQGDAKKPWYYIPVYVHVMITSIANLRPKCSSPIDATPNARCRQNLACPLPYKILDPHLRDWLNRKVINPRVSMLWNRNKSYDPGLGSEIQFTPPPAKFIGASFWSVTLDPTPYFSNHTIIIN